MRVQGEVLMGFVTRTSSNSRNAYKRSTSRLRKFKSQLKDLFKEKFLHLNESPWNAPVVLFVENEIAEVVGHFK